MRILVCGGRDFTDHIKFNRGMVKTLNHASSRGLAWEEITIVHGAARGADTLAGLFAKMFGLEVEAFHADWEALGTKAGPERNQRMLNSGIDLVVAFPGGSGTADMVRRARKADVRVIEVEVTRA